MVWDNQDTDELQNHDHVVALLIRPYILHRRIMFSIIVQDLLIKQGWDPLNAARLTEIILRQQMNSKGYRLGINIYERLLCVPSRAMSRS